MIETNARSSIISGFSECKRKVSIFRAAQLVLILSVLSCDGDVKPPDQVVSGLPLYMCQAASGREPFPESPGQEWRPD